MKTAIFAHNPLNGGFDRLVHPIEATKVRVGKDLLERDCVYAYGYPFEAPVDATEEDLEFICPRESQYAGQILSLVH